MGSPKPSGLLMNVLSDLVVARPLRQVHASPQLLLMLNLDAGRLWTVSATC